MKDQIPQYYQIVLKIYDRAYTYTHTHIYIYIYICVCVCVCVCVRVCIINIFWFDLREF